MSKLFSSITDWFDHQIFRISRWRPGGNRRRRDRNSFNRDRKLSFSEIHNSTTQHHHHHNHHHHQQQQQQQRKRHKPTESGGESPPIMIGYYPDEVIQIGNGGGGGVGVDVQSKSKNGERSFIRRLLQCSPCCGVDQICSNRKRSFNPGTYSKESNRSDAAIISNRIYRQQISLNSSSSACETASIVQLSANLLNDQSTNSTPPIIVLDSVFNVPSSNSNIVNNHDDGDDDDDDDDGFNPNEEQNQNNSLNKCIPTNHQQSKPNYHRHQSMPSPNSPNKSNNNNNNNNSFLQKLSKKSKISSIIGESYSNQINSARIEVSTKRLMKELAELMRRQQTNVNNDPFSLSSTSKCQYSKFATTKSQFTVELVNELLYEWYIKIYEFDKDSQIYLDMQQHKVPFVKLHAIFPDSYPFDPPFIRVVAPYIERGYVMEGGAICLELLTKNGWTSAYTMEAVIIQLMASFVKGQARIKAHKDVTKSFTRKSAENSFRHIVRIHDKHGWVDTPIYEG